jgi:hypothetical protein
MIPSLAVCAVAMEIVRPALRNYEQSSLVRYAGHRFAGHECDKEHTECVKCMRGGYVDRPPHVTQLWTILTCSLRQAALRRP